MTKLIKVATIGMAWPSQALSPLCILTANLFGGFQETKNYRPCFSTNPPKK